MRQRDVRRSMTLLLPVTRLLLSTILDLGALRDANQLAAPAPFP